MPFLTLFRWIQPTTDSSLQISFHITSPRILSHFFPNFSPIATLFVQNKIQPLQTNNSAFFSGRQVDPVRALILSRSTLLGVEWIWAVSNIHQKSGLAQTIYAPVDKHVSDYKFDFSFLKISPDHQVGERYLGGDTIPTKIGSRRVKIISFIPTLRRDRGRCPQLLWQKLRFSVTFTNVSLLGQFLRISRQKVVWANWGESQLFPVFADGGDALGSSILKKIGDRGSI